MLSEILIIAIRGIAIGSIFATIAMSFNIVHGATGILNFAQGNMFVLGGFAAFFLANNVGVAWWLAMLPIAGILVAACALAALPVTLVRWCRASRARRRRRSPPPCPVR